MPGFNFFDPPEDEINFKSFTKFSLFCFKLLCFDINPLSDNANWQQKIEFCVKRFGAMFFLFALFLATFSDLGYAIAHSDDLVAASSSILDVFTTVVVVAKGFITFRRKTDIYKLFQELEDISKRRVNRNKEYEVKKHLDNYHFYMKIYVLSSVMISIPVVLLIVPFLLRGEMGMMVKFWFPFDAFMPQTYPIVIVWSYLIVWAILNYAMATDSMLYAFLTLVAMELDILKIDLMKFSYAPRHGRAELMRDYTDRHNQLLNIVDKLQDIYSITIFLSFAVSSLNLCFVAFRLILVDADLAVYSFYIPYVGIICGQIFYLCIFGQKLIDASESIGVGAYFSEWETIDENDLKKQFVITICRAHRPKLLTALGFADMSLKTFTTVSFS